ncbi:hypothetical protein [Mycobacterium lepromatosis]|uniref:hypothetical protein n=1 Tax=Mycobacterium lepromatosis TaxID=480418 RepID=UPI000A7CB8F3|nr:hypothetical protein [Mycobacterium lepromatosis]
MAALLITAVSLATKTLASSRSSLRIHALLDNPNESRESRSKHQMRVVTLI